MTKGVSGFLAFVFSLLTIVVIVLFSDTERKQIQEQETRKTFQSSLGGIGTGATTVPAWNFGDFDSRLQPGGYDRSYPLPAGYPYSPDRLTMVTGLRNH